MTGLLNWRRLVAVVVLTIGVAIALAVASGGRAGSVAPGTLKAAVEPQFLTAGEDGVTFGKFMAPSGAGTGSATNSSMIFDVDNGLLEQNSPVCVRAASSPTPGFTRWTCALGTINAGQSAGAFVNFRGPAFLPSPATNIYTVKAFFTADTGKSTKGGGGQNSTPVVVDTTQIVDVPNGRRAGNCTGTAATPAGDPQFTTLTGIPAASIATCPWVFVGEDDAPAGSEIRSQISFWGFPLTEPGHPARWVMDGDLPSGPFNKLTLYYLANYSPDNPDTGKVPFPACVNGAIVAPATACYDTFTKVGSRFHAEGFVNGTGGDPGAGVG